MLPANRQPVEWWMVGEALKNLLKRWAAGVSSNVSITADLLEIWADVFERHRVTLDELNGVEGPMLDACEWFPRPHQFLAHLSRYRAERKPRPASLPAPAIVPITVEQARQIRAQMEERQPGFAEYFEAIVKDTSEEAGDWETRRERFIQAARADVAGGQG